MHRCIISPIYDHCFSFLYGSSCYIYFSSQVATLHPSSVSNVIWSKINIRTMIHSVKPLIRKRFSSNKRQIMIMTIWTNQNKEDDADDEVFHQSVLTWTMHLLPASKPLIKRSRSSNQRQIIANADQPSHLQMWLQPLDTSCIYSTNWNGSQIKD